MATAAAAEEAAENEGNIHNKCAVSEIEETMGRAEHLGYIHPTHLLEMGKIECVAWKVFAQQPNPYSIDQDHSKATVDSAKEDAAL